MICVLCSFDVEMDDALVVTANQKCICLYCWERITGNYTPVSKQLRHDIYDALSHLMPDEARNFRQHPFGYQA